jgi:competence protein ComEC
LFLGILAGVLVGLARTNLSLYAATNVAKNSDSHDAISCSKNWLVEQISDALPEQEASLGTAYLLGEKDGLSDEFKDYLRIAGLSHVVVASGAHLSIIVGFVRKVFGKISRRVGLVFGLIFVLIFMSLVGFTPSILRAGIMTILTLVAWYVGRKFKPWKIILITAAITLLIDPHFLTDVGWQLSFASFAGIMLLGPSLIRYFYGEKKPKFFGSMIITTLAANLLVAPISLYYFGSISLISVVANIVILPTLSFVMGVTFLTGILHFIPFINAGVAWVAEMSLKLHCRVIEFLGQQNYFLVSMSKNNPLIFLIYFVVLIPFVIDWTKQRKNAKINGSLIC